VRKQHTWHAHCQCTQSSAVQGLLCESCLVAAQGYCVVCGLGMQAFA
jgi:hypothetical protein